MKNTLKALASKYYTTAFILGLTLAGVEDGRPVWLGQNLDAYFKITASFE